MKNVYTIVSQEYENKVFARYANLRVAKKEFNSFYYWHPDETDGIMLYKNGSIYSEEYCRTNPKYR